MSYCVHCGVKLASYETVCPLCGTPVIDPNAVQGTDQPRFEDYIETTDRKVDRHFLFTLISALSLIPFIITAIVDYCLNHSFGWSLLVLGGEVVLWAFIMLPYRFSFAHPSTYIIFDTLAVALYLLMITLIFGMKWYLPLGLPLTVLSGLLLYVFIRILFEGQHRKLMTFGSLSFSLSLYLCLIDLIITIHNTGRIGLKWSYWPFVPLFTIGIIAMLFSRSQRISSWLKRRLFI